MIFKKAKNKIIFFFLIILTITVLSSCHRDICPGTCQIFKAENNQLNAWLIPETNHKLCYLINSLLIIKY